MFNDLLFQQYYEQINEALLLTYNKIISQIYLEEIQVIIQFIKNNNFQAGVNKIKQFEKLFQERYQVIFKPLTLPEESIKTKIRTEIEQEWSDIFKSSSESINTHNFYKAIEKKYQFNYDEIIDAIKVLAKDLKVIAEVQQAYIEATNLAESKKKLLQNLLYLAQKSQTLFQKYYIEISELRNNIDKYSAQTIENITQLQENLSLQVKQLIAQEKSTQSEYQQFFLEYRLLIIQELDPICDCLSTFSLLAQKLRSDFIEELTKLEIKHSETSELDGYNLDQKFKSLSDNLKQIQAVEEADKNAHQSIKLLSQSTELQFFQDVLEETEQRILRSIEDSIAQTKDFSLMLQQIESFKQEYENKVKELSEVEHQYLKLREETIKSINPDIKFSISSLNLGTDNINEIFIPEKSYRLIRSQLNSYNTEANQEIIKQLDTDGMMLSISDLGEATREATGIEAEFSISKLSKELSQQITQLNHVNTVGFIPIFINDSERSDIPAIMFFCRDLNMVRPEITVLLEIVQEDNFINVRKSVNISPLSSQVINNLLNPYKAIFRNNSSQIKLLIADQFLANKLKLDFQGQVAKVMAQAKKNLEIYYLEELKHYVLKLISTGNLENNLFLTSVDNLINMRLDTSLASISDDESELWSDFSRNLEIVIFVFSVILLIFLFISLNIAINLWLLVFKKE